MSVLVGVALAAIAPRPARADTFLLENGAKVRGELESEFVGADEQPWLRVATPFGAVQFAKKQLKRHLKSNKRGGALFVASIRVSTMSGVVEKSADRRSWVALSPTETAGTTDSLPCNRVNGLVRPGDRVRTGDDGAVDFDIGWGVLHLAAASEVEFSDPKAAEESSMRLRRGSMGGRMKSLPSSGTRFRVETPQASMGVRGTTFVIHAGDVSRFAVQDGEIEVDDASVAAGTAHVVSQDGTVTTEELNEQDQAVLERLRRTYSIPRIERSVVPGGRFRYPIGSGDDSTYGHSPDFARREQPWKRVRVSLDAFQVARHEVTNEQYQVFLDFMAAHDDHRWCHPSEPEGHVHARPAVTDPESFRPGRFRAPRQPAVDVAWLDAFAFCAWVGGSLPSDAQWDWTARQATPFGRPLPKFNPRMLEYAWFSENARDPEWKGAVPPQAEFGQASAMGLVTREVGLLAPDRLGLFDLRGNASEWVLDWADHTTASVPANGTARPDPPAGTRLVERYIRGSDISQSAHKIHPRWGRRHAAAPYFTTGFRPFFELRD